MRKSIKARITLWYAALIVLICLAALLSLMAITGRAQQMHAEETLRSATVVIIDELEIEHGMLEIDSDIDEIPNVYAALLDEDGGMIYGRRYVRLPLQAGDMRRTQHRGHSWYVLDTHLDVPNVGGVWLRVCMSSGVSLDAVSAAAQGGLWVLGLLAVVALWGGYAITRRALRPVKEMTDVAQAIVGGEDLSGRAALSGYAQGGDELHALAATLLGMLERLSDAFARERQFTNDAAHELRTPLNAMRAQGEYALSRADAAEKDEAVARMLDQNEEMRRLLDQLLMIARMDAGQIDMEDGVDLGAALSRVAEDMEPVALERGAQIETAISPVRMRGNRGMLTRAAINLLDNAIRYGREGGTVRLSLFERDDEAVIRVEDDGPGLAPEALSHVFERFWRGDSARSAGGTGIGLAIVQAVARAHGGQADAQSQPGQGCRFEIRIPKNQA